MQRSPVNADEAMSRLVRGGHSPVSASGGALTHTSVSQCVKRHRHFRLGIDSVRGSRFTKSESTGNDSSALP